MRYFIGSATFGYPILWQQEEDSGGWVGASIKLEFAPVDLITNYDAYQFARYLQGACRIGDWVFASGGFTTRGWYQVQRVSEWCAYIGHVRTDPIPFLYLLAHADNNKDNVTFRRTVEWRDRLLWDLYGFRIF